MCAVCVLSFVFGYEHEIENIIEKTGERRQVAEDVLWPCRRRRRRPRFHAVINEMIDYPRCFWCVRELRHE